MKEQKSVSDEPGGFTQPSPVRKSLSFIMQEDYIK
jgi:hypothetical protein